MADRYAPGNGLWGWFGRQVGHVKTAIKHDPTKRAGTTPKPIAGPKAAGPKAAGSKATKPQPASSPAGTAMKQPDVLYRADQVEELPHPTNPQLKLRRTVIDEVIVDPKKKES